ncbi:hydrogenase maturation nickel metallochaperone HypA [Streptomyces oceani]|uniref:Hydrogenase maturation factor HypA n=1 Tax=Streptomyces oceani TaxID=1075402 RepID=A0A1E7JML6_9ACTN|nr:hydrogenase maturation nickel metallochaperone HypA [Streptomyces oceani]OEU89093.1 hydrogenase nickel incorporation protein HypA [Streptomyces oceani]
MHEMSIALAVVDQVSETVRTEPPALAEEVRLQVGELAGVVPEALEFCFGLACAGTTLEGAALHIESVPGLARCSPCAREWATGMPPQLCCPDCGGARAELLSGRELRVLRVRWSDPVPATPATPSRTPREP